MKNIQLDSLLEQMWQDYCKLNPQAKIIHDLVRDQGEIIINDHMALRTLKHEKLGLKSLSKHFENLGYVMADQEYFFTEKKLYARHFEHPEESYPKIFISELELEKLSPFVRTTMENIIDSIPAQAMEDHSFTMSGAHWERSFETYTKLAKESEYASWVYALGFRPNHFTISINHLKNFTSIEQLNAFIKANGFILNSSGGEIKGAPKDFLEQSSTMAFDVPINFIDGTHKIPGCFYEFARRYQTPDGKLYSGFVTASADKIFESTNKGQEESKR